MYEMKQKMQVDRTIAHFITDSKKVRLKKKLFL